MLTSVAEELHDVPLFYPLQQMCNTLRAQCPPLVSFFSALMRQGYRVSRSHTDSQAIKTDAPPGAVWDVMRSWAEDNPPTKLSETSAGYRLLAKPYTTKADFTKLAAAEQVSSPSPSPSTAPSPSPSLQPTLTQTLTLTLICPYASKP